MVPIGGAAAPAGRGGTKPRAHGLPTPHSQGMKNVAHRSSSLVVTSAMPYVRVIRCARNGGGRVDIVHARADAAARDVNRTGHLTWAFWTDVARQSKQRPIPRQPAALRLANPDGSTLASRRKSAIRTWFRACVVAHRTAAPPRSAGIAKALWRGRPSCSVSRARSKCRGPRPSPTTRRPPLRRIPWAAGRHDSKARTTVPAARPISRRNTCPC